MVEQGATEAATVVLAEEREVAKGAWMVGREAEQATEGVEVEVAEVVAEMVREASAVVDADVVAAGCVEAEATTGWVAVEGVNTVAGCTGSSACLQ